MNPCNPWYCKKRNEKTPVEAHFDAFWLMKLRLAWQKHPLLVWAPLAKWHVARRKLGCQRVARRRKQHCATLGSPKTWSKMVKPTQPQSCMAGVHRWCVRFPSKKLPRYAGRESRQMSVHCSKHSLPDKHKQVYPSCSHMPAFPMTLSQLQSTWNIF